MRQIAFPYPGSGYVTWVAGDTAHLMGACRMGSDPRTSVVDAWCRSWEVPNLCVCEPAPLSP